MQSIIIRNDGDDPANEFIIGSGPEALLCRYHFRPPRAGRAGPAHPRIRRRLSATTIPA